MSDPAENVDWARALPLAHTARVVTVAGQLLALEKPAGLMTHPNKELDRNYSLLRAAYDPGRECYHWEPSTPAGPKELFLLNRLDSPTSGLVLAALDEETAVAGRRAFAGGNVQKTYYALVLGQPRPGKGTWTDRLTRLPSGPGRGGSGVRVVVSRGGPGQSAETRYECIKSHGHAGAMLSLLRLEPVTGRTHQLRVQCGAHRHPIVGHATYGDFPFNREFARRTGHKRLFLHAASLRIPSLKFSAESPLPHEFQVALGQEEPRPGEQQRAPQR
jgi:23S rRNA-/tRNA-specific pseudouridylate synthase